MLYATWSILQNDSFSLLKLYKFIYSILLTFQHHLITFRISLLQIPERTRALYSLFFREPATRRPADSSEGKSYTKGESFRFLEKRHLARSHEVKCQHQGETAFHLSSFNSNSLWLLCASAIINTLHSPPAKLFIHLRN